MMQYGWGRFGGMLGGSILAHIISGLAALAVLALVVLLIVVIARNSRHVHMAHQVNAAPQANGENSAVRILDERFAKGEIDEEEYNRKKEILLKK